MVQPVETRGPPEPQGQGRVLHGSAQGQARARRRGPEHPPREPPPQHFQEMAFPRERGGDGDDPAVGTMGVGVGGGVAGGTTTLHHAMGGTVACSVCFAHVKAVFLKEHEQLCQARARAVNEKGVWATLLIVWADLHVCQTYAPCRVPPDQPTKST